MMQLKKSCIIFLLLSIGTAKCNVPSIEEALDLAKLASSGIAIDAVDQDVYLLLNNFKSVCRMKLSENDLKLIKGRLNAIDEQVYYVNGAYAKFKELFKNGQKSESDVQKEIEVIWHKYYPAYRVQKIYEQIIDPSESVLVATLGHNENPNSNVITKSSAAYLLGLFYEVVVYTEIKSLALQLYFCSTFKKYDGVCSEERAKNEVRLRLSNMLYVMNEALKSY